MLLLRGVVFLFVQSGGRLILFEGKLFFVFLRCFQSCWFIVWVWLFILELRDAQVFFYWRFVRKFGFLEESFWQQIRKFCVEISRESVVFSTLARVFWSFGEVGRVVFILWLSTGLFVIEVWQQFFCFLEVCGKFRGGGRLLFLIFRNYR